MLTLGFICVRWRRGGIWAGWRGLLEDVLAVIEASGKDVLLIETTGVGQGEIEVVGLADAVAVVLVPGMGDSIQSLKAGLLEIASVFVLNKADAPGIERLEAEIGEMIALSAVVAGGGHDAGQSVPPVLRTVATTGEGVVELLGVLDSRWWRQSMPPGAKALRHFEGSMWLRLKPVPSPGFGSFGDCGAVDCGFAGVVCGAGGSCFWG